MLNIFGVRPLGKEEVACSIRAGSTIQINDLATPL
jgi:hypothetical protein